MSNQFTAKVAMDQYNEASSFMPLPTIRLDDTPLPESVSANVNKDIDATLDERGSRYGKFTGHAAITQSLKAAMCAAPKWAALQPDQKEALEMVQHKIGRILNGDPDYHDSWHDIVGYAKLVADRLEGVQR